MPSTVYQYIADVQRNLKLKLSCDADDAAWSGSAAAGVSSEKQSMSHVLLEWQLRERAGMNRMS